MFISFEGPEGSGKTTQAQLLAAALRARGYAVVAVHEPGATAVGEAIRHLLLSSDAPRPIGARCEALLFAAARAQLVDEVIRPALARGEVVICDRFADSTFAYQMGGRALAGSDVRAIVAFAVDGVWPDLTFLLDLDVASGLQRKESGATDRLEAESLAFHERVRAEYQELARAEPGRVVVLDARRSVEDLAARILERVSERLAGPGRSAREE